MGIERVRAALDALAARVASRAACGGPARLHVDRVFTVVGRGTVVTGTLWSGAIAEGDELELVGPGRDALAVRVRGLQVHDEQRERAEAGQRVAVNLLGARVADVARGDVLAAPGAVRETRILDCALKLRDAPAARGERVQVHHGARDVPGRLALLDADAGLWQLRLEAPLLACDGDRLVIRCLAPPDTLGGGVILDARAGRHGARPEILDRLRALARGEPAPRPDHRPSVHPRDVERDSGPPAEALAALEQRLRAAGPALLSEAQMAGEEDALRALRADGRAVRVSGRLYAHAEVAADTRDRIVALLERDGFATLAQVRDAVGLSRKTAQAFLEHLDAERVTRRLPDDRRELSPRRAPARAEALR